MTFLQVAKVNIFQLRTWESLIRMDRMEKMSCIQVIIWYSTCFGTVNKNWQNLIKSQSWGIIEHLHSLLSEMLQLRVCESAGKSRFLRTRRKTLWIWKLRQKHSHLSGFNWITRWNKQHQAEFTFDLYSQKVRARVCNHVINRHINTIT